MSRFRARTVALLFAISVVAVSSAFGASKLETASPTLISVDLGATRQTIAGFGCSTRVWSDPHLSKSPQTVVPAQAQAQILTDLYRRLGLTISRQVLDAGVTPGPQGPYNFAGKLGADQVAFVKQARAFGLKTAFPGPVYLEDWMKADDPASYVTYAMTILRYWRSHGYEPPLYAPINEPQISHDFPPRWMHDVVLMLGRQLQQAGFKTKLVIPDDENPNDAYRRAVAVLSDPAARKYVGAVAFHIYKGSESDWPRLHALAARYGLPLWMTEYWSAGWDSWPAALDWGSTMNDLLSVGGVSAIDYIWGFFGDWAGGAAGAYISMKFDNGQYQGFTRTPLYYITGQYSRFVRPGYVRVALTGGSHDVQVTAFRSATRAVVVAINAGDGDRPLRVAFRRGRLGKVLTAVRTSANEQWRNLPRPRLVNGAFATTLPPKSITTFVLDRRRT